MRLLELLEIKKQQLEDGAIILLQREAFATVSVADVDGCADQWKCHLHLIKDKQTTQMYAPVCNQITF